MASHQVGQGVQHISAHLVCVLKKVLVFDDAKVFQCRRRPGSAPAKGRDIAEIVHWVRRVVLEQVKYFFRGHQTGNCSVS